MNVSSRIPAADRDQLFADWGIPATLLKWNEVYDPSSGLRAEEQLSTTLTVVQGGGSQNPSRVTAASHTDTQFSFLVRCSELPHQMSWQNCRLVAHSQTFLIVSTTVSQDGGAVLLNCRPLPSGDESP